MERQKVTLFNDLDTETVETLNRLGAEFLSESTDNPQEQYVLLPEGWSKQETVGALGYSLFDARGNTRTGVLDGFRLVFLPRFSRGWMWCKEQDGSQKGFKGWVSDSKKFNEKGDYSLDPIHVTEYVPLGDGNKEFSEDNQREEAKYLAEEWLDNNYPDWRDVLAYWD